MFKYFKKIIKWISKPAQQITRLSLPMSMVPRTHVQSLDWLVHLLSKNSYGELGSRDRKLPGGRQPISAQCTTQEKKETRHQKSRR